MLLNSGIKIYLKKEEEIKEHDFWCCSFDFFGLDNKDSTFVKSEYDLKKQSLILEFCSENEKNSIKFGHSLLCPVRQIRIQNKNVEKKANQVRIGISVLVEDKQGYVLISRRAKNMRTFPEAWVFPGGGIESFESFEDCGKRELKEEINLSVENKKLELFFIYESVFPVRIEVGTPSRHHIVIYFRLLIDKTHQEIQDEIKIQVEEVDAIAWINKETIIKALSTEKRLEEEFFEAFEYNYDMKQLNKKQLKISQLQNIPLSGKNLPPEERIATGVRHALNEWLLKK